MGRRKKNNRYKVYEDRQERKRLTEKLAKLRRICKARKEKRNRLESKISKLEKLQNIVQTPKRKSTIIKTITLRKENARLKSPSVATVNDAAKLNLDQQRAAERVSETIECVSAIHGATKQNLKPALDGLWSTLTNNATTKELTNYIQSTPKVMSKVIPAVVKKKIKGFELSDTNAARSLKLLYSGGLVSKSKYKAMRYDSGFTSNEVKSKSSKKSSLKFMEGVPMPKAVSYDKLIQYINRLDIGVLLDLSTYCQDLDEDDIIVGKYRDLEDFLLRIAKMYLTISDKFYTDNSPLLTWFDQSVGAFKVAIGADGAPFGKESEATAWLISFLNVGKRVACPLDNFLLCGANCKEDHVAMVRYATDLINQIQEIETKEYLVEDQSISFKFELVPGDMKWVASFGGELNNAAYFFSTFANVCESDKEKIGGTIGTGPDDTWKPWPYDERLRVAEKVEELKEKQKTSPLAESTKRAKILKLIRNEKSRQQSIPVLGKLIDKALAEPLHNMNNAWQYFNENLMNLALDLSSIPDKIHTVSELPDDNPFKLYRTALKKKLQCTLLYTKIKKWFTNRKKSKFQCRFTGKESKSFCHGFMHLIAALSVCHHESPSFMIRLHALAHLGLALRDAVSLFSRQNIDENYVSNLQANCTSFFNTAKMFIGHVNPTVWTIGYAIPYHAGILATKFDMGLGINTMQGREAKHVSIAKFAEHALTSNRWDLVFRHEYITTCYLREQDPHSSLYKSKALSYIPSLANTEMMCYCGYPKEPNELKCKFCLDPIRESISRSTANGRIDLRVAQLLSTSGILPNC